MNPDSSGWRARVDSRWMRSAGRSVTIRLISETLEDLAHLAEGGAHRQGALRDAEQDQLLGADERRAHERRDLAGREPAEVDTAFDLALGDLLEEAIPPGHHPSDRLGHLGVGPAGRDHLLQDPDIARLDVDVEEVAGPLPADPQRLRCVEHVSLPLEEPDVLRIEDREDQLAFRPEVVMDLAERDVRELGDASRREPGIAVLE